MDEKIKKGFEKVKKIASTEEKILVKADKKRDKAYEKTKKSRKT